ncbi:putative membrane-associated kinase regulator 6 [Morella rubra]|uniref:Putative membrane-associated kinase regulator 6 n=1 Tax=Morella rubra TaxID=262757 RepID=A0A6A1W2R4_9ROSI|nr:putative membrane-associated kinase regulator 6 [Morella rubra]
METSQPLATESFSYSWLSNVKPPSDGLDIPFRASPDCTHEATSKELHYKTKETEETHNFDFAIPISQSLPLVHADELFSNGTIKPVFVHPSRIESPRAAVNINSVVPFSSSSSRTQPIPTCQVNGHFLRRWKIRWRRILGKCYGFIGPLRHRVRCSRKCPKVDDIDRRVPEVQSWRNSLQASPQRSTVYSAGGRCDMESSIYEAVLHCKKSIGLLMLLVSLLSQLNSTL